MGRPCVREVQKVRFLPDPLMRKTFREKYNSQVAKIEKLRKELDDLAELEQRLCSHPVQSLRQSDFKEGVICDRRQTRVCLKCGRWEAGWSYYKLVVDSSVDLPVIPYEDMYKYRIGKLKDHEDFEAERQAGDA
jgi:hypothetical protein